MIYNPYLNKLEGESNRRISIDLPKKLIEKFDALKKEWGLRSRGSVLERLLELVLEDEFESQIIENNKLVSNDTPLDNDKINNIHHINKYNENTALVLIPNEECSVDNNINQTKKLSKSIAIDLPGFVQRKSNALKRSLKVNNNLNTYEDLFVSSIKSSEIEQAIKSARTHWQTLYGQAPNEKVVEAAMTWLALDIWSQVEGTDDVPFTWTAANNLMKKYTSSWKIINPNFEVVLVMAGVFEDPFGTLTLPQRMPSLITRFVNKFKRSNKVTSFQTLESTMTVHGALKLLDLPTYAGASLTLIKIRESYKKKAISQHPDAGGTTESMRRLNEAYQLLKELYRER